MSTKRLTTAKKRQLSVVANRQRAIRMELSLAEHAVLSIFREYEMSPHRMLCFSGNDHATHGKTLMRLIERKLLVAESFDGGYSLTDDGYATMRVLTKDRN